MDFVVYNRGQVYRAIPELPYVRISITDPDKDFVPIVENENKILCSLKLKFWDTDGLAVESRPPITKQQAQKILEVMDNYKNFASVVVINCEGGLSRSPGVAAALSKIYEGTDFKIVSAKPFYNKYVYRTILNAYEEKIDKMTSF